MVLTIPCTDDINFGEPWGTNVRIRSETSQAQQHRPFDIDKLETTFSILLSLFSYATMPNLSASTIVEPLPIALSGIMPNGLISQEPSRQTVGLDSYGFSLSKQVDLIRKEMDESIQETTIAPILTMAALQNIRKPPSDSSDDTLLQVGLLAGAIHSDAPDTQKSFKQDPRLFYNISSPSSMFICGSQGSGKSHTLACVLENCLTNSEASYLSSPLTGLVLHYDTFISADGGSPCEAAFLSSCKSINVRVLCSPTNVHTIKVHCSYCRGVDDQSAYTTSRMHMRILMFP